MTRITHGMDVEAVEELGLTIKNGKADRVRHTVSNIDREIARSRSSWTGPSGDLFRSWWPAKRARMLAIADDLAGFGQSALNNAAEQRRASGHAGDPGHSTRLPSGSSRASLDVPVQTWLSMPVMRQLQELLGDLDDVDTALLALPLLGLPLPAILRDSDDVVRLAKILNLRSRVVARQLLNQPIDPKLSGSLGGHTGTLFRWLGSTPKPKFTTGVGLSAGMSVVDVALNAQEYGWGDARTIEAEIKGVYVTGATAAAGPIGGLVAEATWTVGSEAMEFADSKLGISESAVDNYMLSTYGTTQLTPAQATALVERYEGWSGLGNATVDMLKSSAKGWATEIGRGWNNVRSWLS